MKKVTWLGIVPVVEAEVEVIVDASRYKFF
jgi:hypothetical protein